MKAKVNKELKQAMREERRRRRKRDRNRNLGQLFVEGKHSELGTSGMLEDMAGYGKKK